MPTCSLRSSKCGLPSWRNLTCDAPVWFVITSAFMPPPSTERNSPTSPRVSISTAKCAAAYVRFPLLASVEAINPRRVYQCYGDPSVGLPYKGLETARVRSHTATPNRSTSRCNSAAVGVPERLVRRRGRGSTCFGCRCVAVRQRSRCVVHDRDPADDDLRGHRR